MTMAYSSADDRLMSSFEVKETGANFSNKKYNSLIKIIYIRSLEGVNGSSFPPPPNIILGVYKSMPIDTVLSPSLFCCHESLAFCLIDVKFKLGMMQKCSNFLHHFRNCSHLGRRKRSILPLDGLLLLKCLFIPFPPPTKYNSVMLHILKP